MNLAFVVDPLDRLDPTGDTSVALIEAAQELGHSSWIVEAAGLALIGGRAHGPLRRIHLARGRMEGTRWIAGEPWCEVGSPTGPRALDDMDAVFMRTDPPVDRAYLWATYVLDGVDARRTVMVNDPRGIRNANEKLFALRFADVSPPTLVTADVEAIDGFVMEHRRAVAKPIDGHAGRGVLQLRAGDPNLRSIAEVMTIRSRQPVLVQAWVDAADQGNKRILMFGGEILGAVNRVPEPRDFRTGAPCELVGVTSREREIVSTISPTLQREGLRFVGLDTIGDFLVEVNVTSPGGVRQAQGLGAPDMARRVIERLEEEVRNLERDAPPSERREKVDARD